MKKAVLAALLAVGSIYAYGQSTTTTMVGTVRDLTGAIVTSGRITYTLNAPAGGVIPGTGSFVASTVSCGIDINGHPVSTADGTSPCVITQNLALTPTGTSYTQCIQAQFVSPGSCINMFAVGTSIDISAIVPTPTTGPFSFSGTPGPPGPTGPTGQTGPVGPPGNAQWHRLGVVIAPVAGDPMDSGAGHIQEVSTVISTSPELLTGLSKVKEYSFTNGWQPVATGGSGMSVCFGEAPDDVTQPTRYPNCIVNHARSWLGVDPLNGKYLLSAVNTVTGVLDIYEATTISALSSLGSPTYANVISCGSNGNEVSGSLGAGVPIYDATNSKWRMFYGCASNAAGAASGYADWLATGNALNSLTKFQTAPVIGFGSTATAGGNCADCGLSYVTYISGKLYAVGNGGPAGLTPTPYMFRFVDSTGIGNAWTTPDPTFFIADSYGEGMNNTLGQIGQPYLSPMLNNNGTIMNYTKYINGCPSLHVCPYPSYGLAASIPLSLSTVLTQATSMDSSPIVNTQFQVNGAAANCGAVCNLQGAVVDGGNGNLTFSGGGSGYVAAPPLSPTSPGTAGQWSALNGYFYVYDSFISKWLQIAGVSTWTPTYQTLDNFSGTVGTLLSAHTDLNGHSWANYSATADPGETIPLLTGSGAANQPSGAATTAYGDALNSLTPATANYTVSISCTPVVITNMLASLYARASNVANTNYLLNVSAGGAATINLYKVVAGTSTLLGTPYTGAALRPWNIGVSHTFLLQVNGTTITASVDSTSAVSVTDSAISATGQAGFRVSGGGSVTCTNFAVQ